MKLKLKIMMLALIVVPAIMVAQRIGFDEIEDSKVIPWMNKLTVEYQNVYRFGDSEMESYLILIFGIDKEYAQIKYGKWSEDGKKWIWYFENLKNVHVEANKFYSDKFKGEFVIYKNGQRKIKGLKVYNYCFGQTDQEKYEIGTKLSLVKDYYSGKFKQASYRKLSTDDLKKMSKNDLKIMRNEIFARYGFIFKSSKEMNHYFRKQNWYMAQHDNVNEFLTDIEKYNIKLIQSIEN